MHVQPLDLEDRELLTTFVTSHPCGSIEQSWDWGELQTRIPGRPAFRVFGLFEDAALVGGMLVVRQVMGAGKSWLWSPGGPLLPTEAEEGWKLLSEAARNWARVNGDVFLRVEPRMQAGALRGKLVHERYVPQHTLVLDLRLSEAALLEQMTQKGRYNIKQATKNGVAVREGSAKDLPSFYRLLRDTAGRDGFAVHSEDFYRDFLRLPGAKLYLASVNGAVVAGLLATYFGETATYYFGASSSADRESKAAYLLQWTAICEARTAGYKSYDFLGIAPEGEPKHPLAGVTQFKTRFGGKRVSYISARVLVFRPVWWLVYRIAKVLRP
jgi:lipid II:glycine glycyltransferase (peptidoglycan interpeptide bridge formation enzyme)